MNAASTLTGTLNPAVTAAECIKILLLISLTDGYTDRNQFCLRNVEPKDLQRSTVDKLSC